MRSVTLVVHELQRLVVGRPCRAAGAREIIFDKGHWEALARYAERTASPAFRIGHRSITVGHHVGYLRIGHLRVEVLPKLSRTGEEDWRGLLLHMLREVLKLRISVQQSSPLSSRAGALYSVLVGHFLQLVEHLLREGLIRRYRQVEGNESCLRGRLVVHQHVRKNAAHRERLYVSYPVFDADTLHNRILYQGLRHVLESAPDASQRTLAASLAGMFPKVSAYRVRRGDFDRLRLDRQTHRYAESLELARLLLLSERPDLRWGGQPVLSLLFDMNVLFESYVLRQLQRLPGVRVRAQARRVFWRSHSGACQVVKPDLVVTLPDAPDPLIIDTKWKILKADRPSDGDLRQLFAYLRTFGARRGLLLYPRAREAQRATGGVFKADGVFGGVAFLDLMQAGRPEGAWVRNSLGSIIGLA